MSRFWKFLVGLNQPPPNKLDPKAMRFDHYADEYDRSRPSYSPIIFDFLDPSFKSNCKSIADIGAGTGQLTSLLTQYLDPSTRVYAVEPLQRMRAKLTENFQSFDNVGVFGALSDNLSFIEDGSVDGIFCGHSFEWFADINTMKEFQRILSGNDSYLMLVWNKIIWNDSRFLMEIQRVLGEDNDRYDVIRRKVQRLLTPQNLMEHGIDSFERFTYKEMNKTHIHRLTGHELVSLIISEGKYGGKYGAVAEQIKEWIIRYYKTMDAEIEIPYNTIVTYAKCNKSDTAK